MQKLLSRLGKLVNQEDENVYLIAGLGNPGRQYKNNRHNVGFIVADALAEKLGIEFTRMQNKAMVTKGEHAGKRVILAKPRTYMNLSGQSVGALARYYKVPKENLLIIFDDADLAFERLRLKPDGGSSGHNGMKSIIKSLGTEEFSRLRVGIGRPPGKMGTPSYVLQDFSKEEAEPLAWVIDRASDAALTFISKGIVTAMNQFNQVAE
jgi:PTH1 family peptidyl-tRNA hydrolase